MLMTTLGQFRWFRLVLGGDWFLVAPWPHMPYIDPFWTNRPISGEKVLKVEFQP